MFDRIAMLVALSERQHECSDDELRVLDRVLQGIEGGRENYGPLVIRGDARDWREEGVMELRDFLFYAAAHEVARDARERERKADSGQILAGLGELQRAANDNAPVVCQCRHSIDRHFRRGEGFCSVGGCTCAVFVGRLP